MNKEILILSYFYFNFVILSYYVCTKCIGTLWNNHRFVLMKLCRMSIGYNELALLVNESYSKTGDVDLTLKEVGGR